MGGIIAKIRGSRSKSRKNKGDNSGDLEKKSSSKKQSKQKAVSLPESQSARKVVDPRLPFSSYRQIFSIRNAWKAVARTMEECAKENLIRLFHNHPKYKERYPIILGIIEEEELRLSEDFETVAMDIFQVFDDVIANLEEVDKALRDIRDSAPNINLTKTMFKNMEESFIDTIRHTLGPERFPEATENNFKLLYGFVNDEMAKDLEGDPADLDDVIDEPDTVVADTDVEVNLCVNDVV